MLASRPCSGETKFFVTSPKTSGLATSSPLWWTRYWMATDTLSRLKAWDCVQIMGGTAVPGADLKNRKREARSYRRMEQREFNSATGQHSKASGKAVGGTNSIGCGPEPERWV